MRKTVNLLALIVLLLALVGLNQLTANWHYVTSAQAGDVLYAAGFDGFLDEWEQYDGLLTAQVHDGGLRIEVGADNRFAYSLTSVRAGDFDLRLQARAVDGPLNNGYGVIFRFQKPEDSGLVGAAKRLVGLGVQFRLLPSTWQEAGDARSFYLFLVSSDGYYSVTRQHAGRYKEISTWIPSTYVNQGLDVVNHLRVIATGETFRFFVNDQPVDLCIPDDPEALSTFTDECLQGQMLNALTDNTIANGQVGVIAMTLSEPNVAVEFDNLVIVAPETAESGR